LYFYFMQSLAQILASFERRNDGYRISAGADWLQGRTLFGGLVAALANHAMRQKLPEDRPLRALQVVYIGPNGAGDVEFVPSVQREGKAVTLASCTARSAGEVSMTATAMYAAPRESILNFRPVPAIVVVQPDQLVDVSASSGMPGFTQHYHQRWARGAPLFSRATDSSMSVFVRYRNEPIARTTETHALALMDAIPSPALALLDKASPASTLSWTLEILDHQFSFGIDDWWRLDAHVDAAADGYVVHTSHVINPAGRVAAISRQVVVVYG
jgi:acyl-CoA thioesterase